MKLESQLRYTINSAGRRFVRAQCFGQSTAGSRQMGRMMDSNDDTDGT